MLAQGCSHLRAGLGLERPPPDAPLHSGAPHAQQVCAGVGETPRFLPTGTSPQGCWSVLTTCRLPVLRASQREQGESGLSPTIQPCIHTLSFCHSLWLHAVGGGYTLWEGVTHCGRGLHEGVAQETGSLGASWRLDPTLSSREELSAAPVAG